MGPQMAVTVGLGWQVCIEQAGQALEYDDLDDYGLPGNRLLCLVCAGSEGEVDPILKELIVRRRVYRCCSGQRVRIAGGGHE